MAILSTNHDHLLEQSKIHEIKRIEIKQLELTNDGIRIKYNRYNQGRQEECYYPQRGEVSSNYDPKISSLLEEIAEGVMKICGLDLEAWSFPSINSIKFGKDDTSITIIVKLNARNELLGKQQRFTTPKISQLVLTDYDLFLTVKNLIAELTDFYHGIVKTEQTSLAV